MQGFLGGRIITAREFSQLIPVTRRVKGYTRFVGNRRVKGYTRFVGKYVTGIRVKGYTRFVGKYVTGRIR